jgi:Tol biopolymer transport system component
VLRSSTLRCAAAAALAAALLAAAPGSAQYDDSFGQNKIQYREFDWQIYHSPHFDIYYYSAEAPLLEKVTSFAESAYDRLSREFDHQIVKPVPLIFYATHSAFEQNNIILNFIPESIGAFASPARNRMVLPVDLADGELFQLVMHELTHVFQYSILYEDRLGRGIGSVAAPQWFMEGMASYMAKDEGTSDRMFLRDAVVTDRVPSIVQRGVSGFLAYRFGHAAFDYIEERWGKDGFRDFLYEFRNTIGSRPDRALQRALKIDPEDFDLDFRRWLRKKYLPELVATGEPSDFGRPFRDEAGTIDEVLSPVASPSGDLVAALAVTRGDVDLVLYDARKRRLISDLTKGFTGQYQYMVSQYVTAKPRIGRDLAFSPDGNRLVAFVKREQGRSLAVWNVLSRKLERMIPMDVEQQHSPAFSPDGREVAFSGNIAGHFDIFALDLESGTVKNLTNDDAYDGAPVYTPDGASIVYSSARDGEHDQLYRLDLADPTQREQLTTGAWSDKDATFSPDGSWLVFTSDRSGADNIWALELASGRTIQLTNAVTGCMMPTVIKGEDGALHVVYAGFWKGDFDLYTADLDKPVGQATAAPLEATPAPQAAAKPFEPDIRVTLDDANKAKYKGSKLFLEDAGGSVGVTTDQIFLGQAYLMFSDYLGDRRLQMLLDTVDTFSNFDIQYVNLRHRANWGARLFDSRDYFVLYENPNLPFGNNIQRQEVYRTTALIGTWSYPFDLHHRFEAGAGALSRKYPIYVQDAPDQPFHVAFRTDDFVPLVEAAFVGDSAIETRWGPIDGGRWRVSTQYLVDTSGGGTLDWRSELDLRRYVQVSQRTNFAFRLFGGVSNGNFPSYFYLGGLDTLRGYDFRTIVGDHAFVANAEFRFPLIDALVTPALDFRGIRGRIFLDVGGAWFSSYGQGFVFWDRDNKQFENARASYGWGITVRFLGLDLNWDFAKQWRVPNAEAGFRSSFWIGRRF